MSVARAVLVVGAVALCSAGLVALVSRTPEQIRRNEPPPDATDPAHGADFSDEQVARHGAYRGPSYLGTGLAVVVELAVLIVLARGPMGRLVAQIERVPGGLIVHALLAGAAVAVIAALASFPLSFVRGHMMERAWGQSTQDAAGWVSDAVRALLVAAVTAGIAAAAFFGVVRLAPRTWWVWGGLAFTALTMLLVFIYPVAIAPLFNKFTPLSDDGLTNRIRVLGDKAGVKLSEVLVADASRRTTAENAYVAGLGATKQVVLYDTLLASGGEQETLFVVAHELGHRRENHIVKSLLLSSAGLFASFGALYLLSKRAGLWEWARAEGIGDLRALPVLLIFAALAGLVALPLQSFVSRRFEAHADRIAVELTGDPDIAVRSFRRLAFSNLADLRPSGLAVATLYSHPPVGDRIRAVLQAGEGRSP